MKTDKPAAPAKPTPPDWATVEKAQAANLLRKIRSGKVLTARETDFLRINIAAETTPTAATRKGAWMSLTEIGGMIGRNPSGLSRMCAKHRVKPRAKDGKYNLADVQAAMVQAAHDDNRTDTGADTPRNRKIALECQILQAKLNEINRNVVTLDEFKADVQQLVAMFIGGMSEIERGVESITRDAEVLKHVRHIIGATRNRLADEVAALPDTTSAGPHVTAALPDSAAPPPASNQFPTHNAAGQKEKTQ